MAFKINVSHNGKTYKVETEDEFLVGKKIGETVKGENIDDSLKGYELIISGTSDLSGIPGFKGLEGPGYHRRLLTYGSGMKDVRKGIRLRKTNRGEEISLKTHQINIKVVKVGEKKFEDLISPGKDDGEEVKSEEASPGEEKVEEKTEEAPKEEVKEEKPVEEEKKEEDKKEEAPKEEKKE